MTIKKHFLSLEAFAAIVLASCQCTPGQQQQSLHPGEIIANDKTAIATTKQGKVAGYTQDGLYIYKGIPYAKAERFMPPVAADRREGVRSCRQYGPTCPQEKRTGWANDEIAFAFNWNDGYTGEDCLRVNIWTPGIADGKNRPVMV